MNNPDLINIETLHTAVKNVKKHFPNAKPFGGFVLGSGWGDAIKGFNIKKEVPYSEIEGFGNTKVVGHAGKLSLVSYNDKDFFVFQGRRHFYEGVGYTPVILPAYVTKMCGASIFFVSNAAGGISHKPGQLMIITDHINHTGNNPLKGPHHEELGPRFPDMSNVYNKDLVKIMEEAGKKVNVELVKGVYLATPGPSYETPAEINFFKCIGVNAVGMSTIPEAIVANSMGLKVAGISCITNYCSGISKKPLCHEEVVETLHSVMKNIHKLLPEIVKTFSKLKFEN